MSDKIIYKRLDQLTLHQCRDEITRLESKLTDLKAKYQKAVEDADKYKAERDFIKEYLNPADLSFRYMIDAFRVLPVEKQDKLIALAKSLAELGEKE